MKRRPRRPRPDDDPHYKGFVAGLPCAARHLSPCDGHVQVDHAGRSMKGMGRKCIDHETIPLCFHHHTMRTEAHPPFKAMSPDERWQWRQDRVAETQAAYAEVYPEKFAAWNNPTPEAAA